MILIILRLQILIYIYTKFKYKKPTKYNDMRKDKIFKIQFMFKY